MRKKILKEVRAFFQSGWCVYRRLRKGESAGDDMYGNMMGRTPIDIPCMNRDEPIIWVKPVFTSNRQQLTNISEDWTIEENGYDRKQTLMHIGREIPSGVKTFLFSMLFIYEYASRSAPAGQTTS
jgi:hypothetical protein